MAVSNVAVETTKFLHGICNCTVGSDIGTGNFLVVWGFCTCADTHVLLHMLQDMNCTYIYRFACTYIYRFLILLECFSY